MAAAGDGEDWDGLIEAHVTPMLAKVAAPGGGMDGVRREAMAATLRGLLAGLKAQ